MTDCAASLQVCTMRVARLEANGVPDPGAGNVYVTDTLITLGADPVITEGTDFEQPNGCGGIIVSYKDCDRLKRFNLTMTLATPDPELWEFFAGGTILRNDGGDAIGWQAPEIGVDTCPYGVSVEVWTKAIVDGHQADEDPWYWWAFPRTKWSIGGGAKNFGNEIMTHPLTGFAEENPNWFDGPLNDWPEDSGRVYQYIRTDSMPEPSCGVQTLVAS